VRAWLRGLAAERRRFDYRRPTVLLRREVWAVNHKRIYRLYRAEGLTVRPRKRKRLAATISFSLFTSCLEKFLVLARPLGGQRRFRQRIRRPAG
jgi:transposase InsO family protein